MIKLQKRSIVLISAVFLAVFSYFLITSALGGIFLKKPTQPTLEEEIAEISRQENEKIPLMLDDTTQLFKSSAYGTTLTTSLKVINDNYYLTQEWIDNKIKNKKVNTICNDTSLRHLLDEGAIFNIEYYNNNNEIGGKFSIKQSDCP